MSAPEIIKLARLLEVPEEELEPLAAVPEADLRALREQVTDRLYDGDARGLQRIAESARILPVPLVAKVGKRAFGPLLCARLAGLLDAQRAVDVASRWPDEFTAAVAAELDPRRASAVVAAMPADRIVAIASILAREDEHVAMGRFVGHLDAPALKACVDAIDDRSLLRTAFVLEGTDRIDEIVAGLPDDRLPALVEAADQEDLHAELDHIRDHLTKRQAKRLDAAISSSAGGA